MHDLPENAGKQPFALTRRSMIAGAVLAGATGIAFAREPQVAAPVVEKEAFEEWLPTSFDGWEEYSKSGVVLPPPDALQDRLYDNLVTRVYTASGQPSVMLLLAYNNAQDGVVQVHRPEVCYPVGGYDLTPTEPVTMDIAGRPVPSNFFTARGPNRTEHVAYFTRLGPAFPRSWLEQRMAVVRENLNGVIPDGMMMRVSVLGPDPEGTLNVLSDFASRFVAASAPELQRLLIGQNT